MDGMDEDSMDELRSPALPTRPAAPIIVFPSPSTLSSSSFSEQYGVQRNRGQLTITSVVIQSARNPERALRAAQLKFMRWSGIPHWRGRADETKIGSLRSVSG